jgi:IS5 family transposase
LGRSPLAALVQFVDPAAEDALYESVSVRRFVGIDLGCEPVPDETTILNFRHRLERHDLAKAVF